jgi:nucleoid-associated protein EbfC
MNIHNLMQQAQKMQKKMAAVEAEFKNEIFKIEAGGGAVAVTINGDMKVTDISISEDLSKSDDIEMLQDLIVAAVNQSIEKVRKEKEEKMSKVVGKVGGMPGLF